LDGRLVGLAHYALCALLDDVVLNTPWGARGAWRANSLAGALHHDAAAGEHFFDYLEQAKAQPERNRPVLELMAACLALGFEGQYRIAPQGQAALQQIRSELYSTFRRMGGGTTASFRPTGAAPQRRTCRSPVACRSGCTGARRSRCWWSPTPASPCAWAPKANGSASPWRPCRRGR
jgi:type IV/VI secretion system ImpK/VasF family protein